MDPNKKQIMSPEDFRVAMSAVRSAMELLDTFDWDHLNTVIAIAENNSGLTPPDLYSEIVKDPQWSQKKQLFEAAASFTRCLEDIRKQVSQNNEG